jgi:fermentation-respiration switch protein FrsA (DUF1100 family)
MAKDYEGIGGLILESPYTTLPDVAASTYFFLPVRMLMKDKFDSLSKIGDVSAPLLILHGVEDRIVPIRLGRQLYKAANEPKEMVELEGLGHNDLAGAALTGHIKNFLEGLPKGAE